MKCGNIIIYLWAALQLVSVAGGCTKDTRTEAATGGPADVMLAIASPQTKALSEEDYYYINSVKIYAYKHESTVAGEIVGYTEFNGLEWNVSSVTGSQQTKYFDIHIEETGPDGLVDFIVLLNDGATEYTGPGGISAAPDTPFNTLKTLNFREIKTTDQAGPYAVPMSNEINSNAAPDQNNFTFTIKSDLSYRQVIPINVKRCVARLTLNLAKEGTSDIIVTEVTLHNGPAEAPLILYSDIINNTSNYSQASEDLLNGEVLHLKEGETGTIAETYLLPNPYGSSDPDKYEPVTDDSQDEKRAYILDIIYTIGGGAPQTKTVWLPQVESNQQVNVTGTIKDEVDVTFNINVIPWDESDDINIEYY